MKIYYIYVVLLTALLCSCSMSGPTDIFYERSPAVFKDNDNIYWLVYAVADNVTELSDYPDSDAWHNAADLDTYTVYYKKAVSPAALLAAPASKIDKSSGQRPSGFNQRELGAACLGDDVFVFVSHGLTAHSVYYYRTADGGQTWDDPVEILATENILHVHADAGDTGNGTRIYINAGQAGRGTVYEFNYSGGTHSINAAEWEELNADVLAQTVVIGGELYMIARTGSALTVWHNAAFDTTTDGFYTIDDPVAVSTYDHTFGIIGGTWYAFSAPYDGVGDTQFIAVYTSANLGGPWVKQQLTNPGTQRWDYWPCFYAEGASGYLFYTSEDNGSGHLKMMTLP